MSPAGVLALWVAGGGGVADGARAILVAAHLGDASTRFTVERRADVPQGGGGAEHQVTAILLHSATLLGGPG